MIETFERTIFLLPFIPLILLAVLFLHEFGHYLAARHFGVGVRGIVIGLGKPFWQKIDKSGILWQVAPWPLGAQIILDEADNARLTFRQRIAIILAGPLANIITPLFLFLFMLGIWGFPGNAPLIGAVRPEMPAGQAGLLPGDKILQINGHDVTHYFELGQYTNNPDLEALDLRIARGDQNLSLTLLPEIVTYTDRRGQYRERRMIGVMAGWGSLRLDYIHHIEGTDTKNNPQLAARLLKDNIGKPLLIGYENDSRNDWDYRINIHEKGNKDFFETLSKNDIDGSHSLYLLPERRTIYKKLTAAEWLSESWFLYQRLAEGILSLPAQLFPMNVDAFHYPTKLQAESHPVSDRTFGLLYKMALLSFAIGVINILPLPKLDGGQILILSLEKIKGAPPNRKTLARVFALLFGVIYFSVFLANAPDLNRYFKAQQDRIEDLFDQ